MSSPPGCPKQLGLVGSMWPERNARPQSQLKLQRGIQPAAPRLKGKARKETKAAGSAKIGRVQEANDRPVPVSRYGLITKNLIEQAEAVAKSSKAKILMPDNILRVIRHVIHARQRCSNWLKETGSKDKASTERHPHYIAILERALKILEPCYSNTTSVGGDHSGPKRAKLKQPQPQSKTFDDDMYNPFALLDLEDIDDDVELIAPEVNVASKRPAAKFPAKLEAEHEVWELVDEFHTDIAFIVFSFFEDMHRIQDFLKKIWKG